MTENQLKSTMINGIKKKKYGLFEIIIVVQLKEFSL